MTTEVENFRQAYGIIEKFYREVNPAGEIPDELETGDRGTSLLDQNLKTATGLSLGILVNRNFADLRLHKDPKKDGPFGLADCMFDRERYTIHMKAMKAVFSP